MTGNASFRELVDVVRYDQSISSKIIQHRQFAYYSRGHQDHEPPAGP